MEKTILVEFDGKAFVPVEPVCLPAGTKAFVRVAADQQFPYASPPPPPITEEHQRLWEELCRQWAENPPPWPTIEEALGRPRYEP